MSHPLARLTGMCRNIRQLHNFQPPATPDEMRAALVTTAPPKDREVEAAKARERARQRYAS